MIFKELHLVSFGKFQGETVPFDKGLNIITGANESGKSTLFKAIFGTIFGFKTDRERYSPWNNPSQYCARLILETASVRIHLERNFHEDTVSMLQETLDTKERNTFQGRVSPLGRTSERDIYLKKIQDLFGFSDPDVFKHALFVEQRGLYQLPTLHTATEIKQLIANISEFKYDEIIQHLEDRYFQITKKNPKGVDKRNDRLVENIRTQITEIEEKIRKARYDEKRLLEIGKKISEIKDHIYVNEQKTKTLSRSTESLRELQKILQRETGVHKVFLELKKKKHLVEKLLAQRKEIEDQSPKLNRLFIGILILSAGLIPFIAFSIPQGWIWALLALGILGVTGTKYYLDYKEALSHFELKDVRLKSQLEVLPEPQQLESEYQSHQKMIAEIEIKKTELERNIREVDWGLVTVNADALHRNLAEQEAQLERTHYEIKQLQALYHTEKQNYLLLSKGLESPFSLEEDLYDLKEKEKIMQTKAQALLMAKELLRDIVIQFRKEHLNIFSDRTTELFTKIVSRPYKRVVVEEMNLSPNVFTSSDDNTTPISMEAISCGTQDQLFFAMKVAMLDLMTSKKLPLFLDDPFVNFDHERRKMAMVLLTKLAEERQIFLFTYDPWYSKNFTASAHVIHMGKNHESNV